MILTVDIGIKNLALCVINFKDSKDLTSYTLPLWDTYNILNDEDDNVICGSLLKNKKFCSKKSSYKYKNEGEVETKCCKTHFPKHIKITNKNKIKIKKISDYLLQDIVKIFIDKIDYIYTNNIEIFNQVDEIYIELQPKINQKMKMISHILFGKFVEIYKEKKCKIRFVSAVKKLKAYKGPFIECKLKDPYKRRKWLSIEYCKWFLETKFSPEEKDKWFEFFTNHKKRDDISDAFLMAINECK